MIPAARDDLSDVVMIVLRTLPLLVQFSIVINWSLCTVPISPPIRGESPQYSSPILPPISALLTQFFADNVPIPNPNIPPT